MSIVAEGKMVQDVSGVALNVVNGQAWELSETAITATKDIIVKEGGKVVSHVQVKDTVNCINKTIQKASIGECGAVQVSGTAELAAKAAENTKQLAGIQTGKQIAGKALSRMPSASAVGAAAKAGGVVGATVGAGIEAMYSVGEVIRGKKDVVDAAGDIAYAGAKGGASGYAGAAAGTVAAGATSAAIATTGIATGVAATGAAATAVALAPVVVGFGAACVVGSFVSDLFDDIFG